MKTLSKGCSYTEPWVSPENWKTTSTKSSLKKNWYVQCNFFDPVFEEKYPNGFPFRRKLNKFKTIEERRTAAELLLDEIPRLFGEMGYNPITKIFSEKVEENTTNPVPHESVNEMLPETPFLKALELAKESKKFAKTTESDIKYMLVKFSKAVKALELHTFKIFDIQRKHIRQILDHMEKTEESFSAHKFNKYCGYLSILWNELTEYEAVNGNVITGIQKRIHEKQIRDVLTEDERVKVNEHLKINFPEFWRFTMIFFHSGGRISELLDLKIENVHLATQRYKVLIKKGRQYKWVERVIKDIAVEHWIRVLLPGQKGDYVFSRGLVPGSERIRREQISRRWNVHVKKKLDISADFYALKHLNLDETSELLSMADAAKMANHTSTRMIEQHYAVGERDRQLERLKGIANNFVKEKQNIL